MRHSHRVYPRDPLKKKKKSLPPLPDQKTHLSCLFSVSITSTQRLGKERKKEKLTDISWYSSVYKRNIIPSKANKKLSTFSLHFYYFY